MKERFKNCHLGESNQSLILRDGELFNRKLGFGFYSEPLVERHQKKGLLIPSSEPRIVWLKKETEELYRRITEVDHSSPLLVEGSLGQGKSALIYGLRAMFRENGLPYCYIDGHFTTTPEEKILSSLWWAERNNAVVFWDSLDYLLVGSKKKRKLPLEEHLKRSRLLILILLDLIREHRIKLIGTSHDQTWLNKYGHSQLLEQWNNLTKEMKRHNVRGVFDTNEELNQFLSWAGLPPDSIELMIRIANYHIPAFKAYKMLKLFALGNHYNSSELRSELARVSDGDIDFKVFLEKLRNFVDMVNKKVK